jgi:hypothetical protein
MLLSITYIILKGILKEKIKKWFYLLSQGLQNG